MKGFQEYQKWLESDDLPKDLQQELKRIQGDTKAIEDRFGYHLHFGTGGMRGVLGVGPNRMNIYTVRRTSWALAQYVLQQGAKAASRGVAIGYDCRHMSQEFAKQAALTLAAAGVRSYVSPYLSPTPEVSYTVRHLKTAAGIMITASHNPPEYNGYKVYGESGYQLLPEETHKISEFVKQMDDVFRVPILREDEAQQRGLFEWTDPQVRTHYVAEVVQQVMFSSVTQVQRNSLKIVYTPLHGAGNVPVRQALQEAGYPNVQVVPEQEQPDGDFPTVKSPNPEEHDALKLAIQQAERIEADLVMGTDPDSDRVGIAVRNRNGSYELLTGNQTGALLTEFILNRRKAEQRLPENGIVFKTVVTSELGRAIAESYQMAVENTLTGFKYIGERITQYESTGQYSFLLGYEESYGYLISSLVRDKDAVQTCLAISEMTAFYKGKGQTLLDVLQNLYERFGYYEEELFSIRLEGADAETRIKELVEKLRSDTPQMEGLQLVAIEDYERSVRTFVGPKGKPSIRRETLILPVSDVLKYLYEDGSWLAVRPSGTEPKLKAYLSAKGTGKEDCTAKVGRMRQAIQQRVKPEY